MLVCCQYRHLRSILPPCGLHVKIQTAVSLDSWVTIKWEMFPHGINLYCLRLTYSYVCTQSVVSLHTNIKSDLFVVKCPVSVSPSTCKTSSVSWQLIIIMTVYKIRYKGIKRSTSVYCISKHADTPWWVAKPVFDLALIWHSILSKNMENAIKLSQHFLKLHFLFNNCLCYHLKYGSVYLLCLVSVSVCVVFVCLLCPNICFIFCMYFMQQKFPLRVLKGHSSKAPLCI